MVIFYTPKLLPILRTLFDFILCNDMGYSVNDYIHSVNDIWYFVNDYFGVVYFREHKNRFFTAIFRQKMTETPIFQGISVVLPKLYLGGGRGRSRSVSSMQIAVSFLLDN